MDSSDEDAKPLVSKAFSKNIPNGNTKSNGTAMNSDKAPPNQANSKRARQSNGKSYKEPSSDESDDEPLNKKRRISSQKKAAPRPSAPESDSDKPLVKSKPEKRAPPKTAPTKTKVKEESNDDEDDIPLVKKAKIPKAQALDKVKVESAKTKLKANDNSVATKKIKKAVKEEEEAEDAEVDDEEEEYRWWEDPTKGDGSIKWTSLQHNGVVFPPLYVPLPKTVKLIYDGTPVSLQPDAEEVACFYGSMLHSTVNVENPTFNKNFFSDFQDVLKKVGHGVDKNGKTVKIEKFEKCDFKPIFDHFEAERFAKRALSSAEKKEIKKQKDEDEAPYMYCLWDGRKQKVGNFRVEPPGLFRGRGEHPKTGRIKKRVMPEQVTINIGKDATVPAPPVGHKWKEVKHDQTGTWLATWQENINGAYKYVMLAANSDVKGQSDHKKFEKARELEKFIGKIRREYTRGLQAERTADRQLATAVYLIDKFALRAGNEKGDDEAETVGCCSLKFEHVTLEPPNKVIFDFLGKDSIRFYNEFDVDRQVFKNLRIFKKGKSVGDDIFDRVTTSSLNKHLSNYMPGLTAKVFRTYNASRTMSDLLQKMQQKPTVAEMVLEYNAANRQVAIICNHKRTVGAAHEGQMEKMQGRINGLRYQQWRTKQMMLDLEPKLKKTKGGEFFQLPEDLGGDWVIQHQKELVEEAREKVKKKFSKDNEKLEAEGSRKMPDKDLRERLEVADELEKKFRKENKSKKIEAEGRGPTVEKLEGNLEKLNQRIENLKMQAEDKEDNKEVALGTSKINYIDPRLTVVFSKKFDVPIERMFSKTLREKFDWAIKSVDEGWTF